VAPVTDPDPADTASARITLFTVVIARVRDGILGDRGPHSSAKQQAAGVDPVAALMGLNGPTLALSTEKIRKFATPQFLLSLRAINHLALTLFLVWWLLSLELF
jgi:hypothetical protein